MKNAGLNGKYSKTLKMFGVTKALTHFTSLLAQIIYSTEHSAICVMSSRNLLAGKDHNSLAPSQPMANALHLRSDKLAN